MKKIFALAAFACCALASMAQNLQLHYDFGRHIYSTDEEGRQSVTLTFEQFKADKLGSWFYFIDLDANKDGMVGAYTEISREFTFANPCQSSSLAAHVEWNAGLSRAGGVFQQAALVGPAWNWHNGDFSKTASVQVMYKHFFGQSGEYAPSGYASFQLTGVWGLNFCDSKLTFSGFIDFWRGINASNNHGALVILTEPQLWYNINKKFSVGTEVELSNNFIFQSVAPYANDKFYVNPTLAVKYNF